MKFITALFKRKQNREEVQQEDFKYNQFKITDKDIKEHSFFKRGKTFTSAEKLKKSGDMIDRDIAEYMKKDKARILESKIKDLSFMMIRVNNLLYNYATIDDSIKIDLTKMNPRMKLQHPSYSLMEGVIQNRSNDITLFYYLQVLVSQFIDIQDVSYKVDRSLSFTNKTHSLKGEEETDNKEIFFMGCQEDTVNAMQANESTLYSFPIVFRENPNLFKGIIIQNLQILDNKSLDLENIDKQFERVVSRARDKDDEFENLALDLYNKFRGKIFFISQFNGVILIKGTDREVKKIYSTLQERDLPEIIRNMLRTDYADTNHLSQNKEYDKNNIHTEIE